MKKNIIILAFIMLSSTIFGQDIIINFAGEGASTNVETIEIKNLSNGTSIEIPENSSLNLTTGTVEIKEFGNFENNLIQTYPNPFTDITNIEFYLSKNNNVTVSVTNI